MGQVSVYLINICLSTKNDVVSNIGHTFFKSLETFIKSSMVGNQGCFLCCKKFLILHIKIQLRNQHLTKKYENLKILRYLALTFELDKIDLVFLCSTNDFKQDILINICDFLPKNRTRAIKQLVIKIKISQNILS